MGTIPDVVNVENHAEHKVKEPEGYKVASWVDYLDELLHIAVVLESNVLS